jgi:hypothetical protein
MKKTKELTKTRKIINYILFIIFLLFAVIQLNDPDPLVWFSIYGIVALVFLVANFRNIPRRLVWIFIIGLLAYASFHFNYFLDWLKIEDKNEIFGEMVYQKPYLEGTREFLGLLIAVSALLYQLKQPK